MDINNLYYIGKSLGLEKKDIDNLITSKFNFSDEIFSSCKTGDKYSDISLQDLYKGGTDYGTISPNELQKDKSYYNLLEQKNLYKAGSRYGTISLYDLI